MKKYYKRVHELLETWKAENNITERCVVHHRDDTPEVKAYNKKYYERWGYNEDDTFEYGKYVVFMTCTDHLKYHNSGDKSIMKRPEVRAKISAARKGCESAFKGKQHTEESKQKNRESHLGKSLSDGHKKKISEALKGEKNGRYGKHHSEEAKNKLRIINTGKHHSEESKQKMSLAQSGEKNGFYGKKHTEESRQKMSDALALKARNDALFYHKYKANGGGILWNAFRKLFHNNDPQVMQYLID